MTVVQLAQRTGRRLGIRARSTSRARQSFRGSTWLVFGISGILLLFGLVMILSSSSVTAYQQHGSSFYFVKRQVLWAIVGVLVAAVLARTDYRKLRSVGWFVLLGAMAALVLVLIPGVGIRVSGSARWLGVGWLRIQPAELAKLGLLLVAADVVARKQTRLGTLKDILKPLGIIAFIIVALVMLQPDLGTTLVIAGIVFVILFVGAVPLRLMAVVGAAGIGGALSMALTRGYRHDRISSFLNPWADKMGSGYQAVQSIIALGSGGWLGVGLGQSRQKWLYVPNAHTDFIYAIIGEELGLFGALIVLFLFVGFAYAGIRVARRAPDTFGRLVAAGITTWIVGQAFLNMGAVTGLLPITGVPLPLVSFGGSSLVFTLASIGVLINIARQEKWSKAEKAAASS
ncbi:MAG: putative lipid II flippase FtsW [Actinomycetota bacterium]